jgi:hypothetical protein
MCAFFPVLGGSIKFLSLVFYEFSLYRSFTFLVKFNIKSNVYSLAVNGITFIISFSASLLLMYRSSTDVCMLVSDPATLINLSVLIVFW